jgi:hypothetical protein
MGVCGATTEKPTDTRLEAADLDWAAAGGQVGTRNELYGRMRPPVAGRDRQNADVPRPHRRYHAERKLARSGPILQALN